MYNCDVKKYEVAKIMQQVIEENDFSRTIKNGIRKCELFPWNPHSPVYSMCVSNDDCLGVDNEIFGEDENEDLDIPDSIGPTTFLDQLEKKLPPEFLKMFRDNFQTGLPLPPEKDASLYEFWVICCGRNDSLDDCEKEGNVESEKIHENVVGSEEILKSTVHEFVVDASMQTVTWKVPIILLMSMNSIFLYCL